MNRFVHGLRKVLSGIISAARAFARRLSRKVFGRRWHQSLRPALFALQHRFSQKPGGPAPRISLVVATYNVAPYIDAFFDSLIVQKGGLSGVEVIVVNDGATDGSGQIADRWAQRFPETIRVIHQKNAGVCAARNAGLLQASGTWIAFPDPDDVLSHNYLLHMRTELQRPQALPLLAVASNMVFYFEQSGKYANHTLRYRFARGIRRVNSTDPKGMYLAHTTSTLMSRADIMAYNIRFDPDVRPSFEDANFTLRLMLATPERSISFLPAPVYYYRKRAAADSKIDRITTDPEWYGHHVRKAYLTLLHEAQAVRGVIPVFIQQAVILSLLAKLRYLTSTRASLALVDKAAASDFHGALAQVTELLDSGTLETAYIPSLQPHERLILAWYKGSSHHIPWVDLVAYNRMTDGNSKICLQWFGDGDVGGADAPLARIETADALRREAPLQPAPQFVNIRGLQECWITLTPDDKLTIYRAGDHMRQPLRLRYAGQDVPPSVTTQQLMRIMS